jgi:hypothetical protein
MLYLNRSKISYTDKSLPKLTKRRKKSQINKIRDEKRIIQYTQMKYRPYGNILKIYTSFSTGK